MLNKRQWLRSGFLLMGFTLACASALRADVVIGDFEGTDDGWIDWGTQAAITAPKYTYSSTIGVTHGSQSLAVTQSGWNQDLALKLQNVGTTKAAFFANKQFSIDFTSPGSALSGWNEVYAMWINAQNYGFTQQNVTIPVKQYGYPNGNTQTTTLSFDYSALVDGNTANGEIDPSAQWVEFILATNSSDADHGVFYFDNARLTSPALRGDFNGDGFIDNKDIDLLFGTHGGEVPTIPAKYDVNNDGLVITTPGAFGSDSDEWVHGIKHSEYGDSNLDGTINFSDLLNLAQHYGATTGAGWADGSFDGDGSVNFSDLLILAQHYGFAATGSFASDWILAQSMVPEPATLGLAGSLAMTALIRRRRAV